MQRKVNSEPQKLAGLTATYQFVITGNDPGAYYLSIDHGQAVVSQGTHPSPNVTITMDSNDFADLYTGKLNAATAFLTGKLRVEGDMRVALMLTSLLT